MLAQQQANNPESPEPEAEAEAEPEAEAVAAVDIEEDLPPATEE